MRIMHISDLHFWHITLNPFRLAGKRLLGMGNLIVNRARKYRMEMMPAILERIEETRPDHLLITGDLTTTSLEEEFQSARKALKPLKADPSFLTVIPGNHDRYGWRSTRARLFERYFGEFAASPSYPWLKAIGGGTSILALDPCHPNLISARGTISTTQLEIAQNLLDAARSSIRILLIACHYPIAWPDGISQKWGHGLNGVEKLRRFLAKQQPHIYCHGHVHTPWILTPKGLPQTLSLNPGSALKKGCHPGDSARMQEIALNGDGVEILSHTLRDGTWKVHSTRKISDFFEIRSIP